MKTFLFLCFFGLSFSIPSYAAKGDSKVLQVIEKEIGKTGISRDKFGIWLKGDNILADINSERLFVPASLSKIPTALSLLNEYDMNHRFLTWIYHTGSIKKGVLQGDLYLKGGGDPSLVTESMWLMINRLKRDDIREIQGRVYVDDSYFDQDYYSKGRQQRRVDRAYDAPVGALSFNWNAISVYVRPGTRPGDKARVYVDPPIPYVKVDNRAITGPGQTKSALKVSRVTLDAGEKIVVSGQISLSKDEKAFYKSVTRPALWTGQHFVYFLNKAGIKVNVGVEKKRTPKEAKLLVEYESWKMPRVIAAMSKFSNNFVAEMLTKHLGKKGEDPASIEVGLEKINTYLMSNGWKKGEYVFRNPSGFTRSNKIQPGRLGELLHRSQEAFHMAPEFLSALPISGTDGTLKDRMKRTMKGKVRAKTGYLSGVRRPGRLPSSEKGAADDICYALQWLPRA